ncbi:MAG: GIY-YIG nuclease family protein [Piscirickettsiaceae bacterium]|nr:GIY-YIG nuclease family protein [Piscirickettsiaceae bacterium]
MKQPCVYILANKNKRTLYTGVTSDLIKRVWKHKNNITKGFTQRYHIHNLVWYEIHQEMESAISREKAIKKWRREWKVQVIEKNNPDWLDLYSGLF